MLIYNKYTLFLFPFIIAILQIFIAFLFENKYLPSFNSLSLNDRLLKFIFLIPAFTISPIIEELVFRFNYKQTSNFKQEAVLLFHIISFFTVLLLLSINNISGVLFLLAFYITSFGLLNFWKRPGESKNNYKLIIIFSLIFSGFHSILDVFNILGNTSVTINLHSIIPNFIFIFLGGLILFKIRQTRNGFRNSVLYHCYLNLVAVIFTVLL